MYVPTFLLKKQNNGGLDFRHITSTLTSISLFIDGGRSTVAASRWICHRKLQRCRRATGLGPDGLSSIVSFHLSYLSLYSSNRSDVSLPDMRLPHLWEPRDELQRLLR